MSVFKGQGDAIPEGLRVFARGGVGLERGIDALTFIIFAEWSGWIMAWKCHRSVQGRGAGMRGMLMVVNVRSG